MTILLYFVLPVLLLVVGIPIYVILLLTAILGVAGMPDLPFSSLQTVLFGSLDSFPLLAVPLFVLAGDIMGHGGLAKRMIAWAMSLIGGIRGSLALTTIASAELFGAMSGSSVGCVAAIGRLLFPSLRDGGYGQTFAIGIIASSGAIAVIIPPSIPMIIYGISAQQSVPALFLAGIFPGLLIGVLAAVYVMIHARLKIIPLTSRARWNNIAASTRDASWSLGAPAVILGGIYGGIFTPTEAAGVAVVYAALVSRYIYREVTWADLWQITKSSMYLVSQLMVIVAAAGTYSWLLTTSGFPQHLVEFVQGLHLSTWSLLLWINVLLLVVGSFLEPPAAILILTPIFLPIMQAAGIDPIHFGIIMTINLAIGMFTPPFGLNLFAAHALFRVPLPQIYRGVLPFMVVYLIALLLITFIPAISLSPLALLKP
ncbi:TRAP transporter large permease [Noviherbaspirillum sp.]|jgi:C4-dicarboxylate transporter DctM subunit|uniref:TRAP transporter large permease n=1 Tax=Noviherbaspirillum sp. TaxID=1926288 RepID=UPI0025D89E1B|nr:TRAP transporter large permease [Noviherbaspirillum sp.]